MTKQKIVIKVSMNDHHASRFDCFSRRKPHSKALRLVGGFPGVQSVALAGDRDQIELTGEVDVVKLTNKLRKKIGHADIVSVGEVKKEGESKDKSSETKPIVWPYSYPHHEVIYVTDPYLESRCWPL